MKFLDFMKGLINMKWVNYSNVRDPENRSKRKFCVCGCHSNKAKRNKSKRINKVRPPHRDFDKALFQLN